MAINYGAGFLPQNLYQNLFDIQRRGIEEERRRQMEPFRNLGSIAGKFAKSNIAQSKEAEDAFIKDMDEQIKERQETLKKYDPQADPSGFNVLEQELSSLRQEKRNKLQQFRGSGFLGMGRDRSSLTVDPVMESRREREGFMQVPGFAGQIKQEAYDPSGIKRKVRETKAVGDVTTDVLEEREGKIGRVQQTIKKEISADTEFQRSELDNMVNRLLAQGEIQNITAQDLYESKGDYDHRQLIKRLTEIEPLKLESELKRIGAIAEPQAKSDALRALLVGEAETKVAVERADQLGAISQKYKTEDEQRKLYQEYGDEIQGFDDDGRPLNYYGEPTSINELKLTKQTNEIFNKALSEEQAGLQEIEVPGKGKLTLNQFRQTEEYKDLKQRNLIETEALVERQKRLTPGKIDELRQTLRTQLNIKEDEYYGLGQKKRKDRIDEAVKTAKLIGQEDLALELQKMGALPNESYKDAETRQELKRLAGELEVKLDARKIELFDSEYQDALLDQVEDRARAQTYGTMSIEQQFELEEKLITNAKNIIEKLGPKIQQKDIEAIALLGRTESEVTALRQFAEATKTMSKRNQLREMLALPDSVIPPMQKFLIAQEDGMIPKKVNGEDFKFSDAAPRMQLIQQYINAGEEVSKEMLEGTALQGQKDMVNRLVKTKSRDFRKSRLMNTISGMVEQYVGEGDIAKRNEIQQQFKNLSNDPNLKKELEEFGFSEQWFSGLSQKAYRQFEKDKTALEKEKSLTALNGAKESYYTSQVPKMSPQEKADLERAKDFRDAVTQVMSAAVKDTGGRVDLETLRPVFQQLKTMFYPKEAQKKLKKDIISSFNILADENPSLVNKDKIINMAELSGISLSEEEIGSIVERAQKNASNQGGLGTEKPNPKKKGFLEKASEAITPDKVIFDLVGELIMTLPDKLNSLEEELKEISRIGMQPRGFMPPQMNPSLAVNP